MKPRKRKPRRKSPPAGRREAERRALLMRMEANAKHYAQLIRDETDAERYAWLKDEKAERKVECAFAEMLGSPVEVPGFLKDRVLAASREGWSDGFREGFITGARAMRDKILPDLQAPDRRRGGTAARGKASENVDKEVDEFNKWRDSEEFEEWRKSEAERNSTLGTKKVAQKFLEKKHPEKWREAKTDEREDGMVKWNKMVYNLLQNVARRRRADLVDLPTPTPKKRPKLSS